MKYVRLLFFSFALFFFSFLASNANAACTQDSDCLSGKFCHNPYLSGSSSYTNGGTCEPNWECVDSRASYKCDEPEKLCINNKVYDTSYYAIFDICNTNALGYKGCGGTKSLNTDCGNDICISKCEEYSSIGIYGIVRQAKCTPQPAPPQCKTWATSGGIKLCNTYVADPTKDNTPCTTTDGQSGICSGGTCNVGPGPCTSCIDGTLKDACNANGEKCKDLLNNGVCTLQADPTCVGCVATLNLNQQGTTNPCTLKPSVSASGCAEGSDFEIRLGSTAACSGKISAGAGSCSQWTIVSSTTYDLWLNDNGWKKKDTKTADCWGGGGGGGCNNNGVQDNGETGVDCGGGGCIPSEALER